MDLARRFSVLLLVSLILFFSAVAAYAGSPAWSPTFQQNSEHPLGEQVPSLGFSYLGVSQAFPPDMDMFGLWNGNIFFSPDRGGKWMETTFNPPNNANHLTIPDPTRVYPAPDFATSHLAVFAGPQGLYSATVSFYDARDPISGSQLSFGDTVVLNAANITPPSQGGVTGGYAFAFGPDGAMYASSSSALYQSTDQGKDWTQIYFGTATINNIALSPDFDADNTMLCATDRGVFISTDGGRHFKQTGLPMGSGTYVLAFSPDYTEDGTIGAIVPGTGVYLSTDRGATWTGVFNHRGAVSLALTGNALYVGTDEGEGRMQGVYTSFDQGETWTNLGLTGEQKIAELVALQGSGSDTLYALPWKGLPEYATITVPAGVRKPIRYQTPPSASHNTIVFTIGSELYTVNGQNYLMDAAPFISGSGRTYVPVRFLAKALGASIFWYPDTQTVALSNGNTSEQLIIGSSVIRVDGQDQPLDAAPEIVGGRTMLPARDVAQAFGYSVQWDGANHRVIVTE